MTDAPSVATQVLGLLRLEGPMTAPEAAAKLGANLTTVRCQLSRSRYERTGEAREGNSVYRVKEPTPMPQEPAPAAPATTATAAQQEPAPATPPPMIDRAPAPEVTDILIADNPHDMAAAQHAMISDVAAKIEAATREARDAKRMRDQMRAARMNDGPAVRMHARATERVHFLVKTKAALEAGYLMMPDMPGEVLAVRTDRKIPSRADTWRDSWASIREPADTKLPVGRNRYVNPRPDLAQMEKKDHQGTTRHYARPTKLRDPSGIDRKFMKPQVIDRMTGAMMKGIFDEIVCIGASPTRGPTPTTMDRDPIVLGRIISKRQVCSFLIAWFVDMREL